MNDTTAPENLGPRLTRKAGWRGRRVTIVRDGEAFPAYLLAWGPQMIRWQALAPNASTPGKWGEGHVATTAVHARD